MGFTNEGRRAPRNSEMDDYVRPNTATENDKRDRYWANAAIRLRKMTLEELDNYGLRLEYGSDFVCKIIREKQNLSQNVEN